MHVKVSNPRNSTKPGRACTEQGGVGNLEDGEREELRGEGARNLCGWAGGRNQGPLLGNSAPGATKITACLVIIIRFTIGRKAHAVTRDIYTHSRGMWY